MPLSTQTDLSQTAKLFHALSDETRLGILDMLGGGERCVCDLQDAFDAAQSRLSYHLKVLKSAGLVVDRTEGRWSYYSVAPEALQEMHDVVSAIATRALTGRSTKGAGACCG
ncbi:MAG: ArsR/SmtB family transcription factor [Gemmatimonas sp.]